MRKRATDVSVFAEPDAFSWRSRISNSKLNLSYTQMSDTTHQKLGGWRGCQRVVPGLA